MPSELNGLDKANRENLSIILSTDVESFFFFDTLPDLFVKYHCNV